LLKPVYLAHRVSRPTDAFGSLRPSTVFGLSDHCDRGRWESCRGFVRPPSTQLHISGSRAKLMDDNVTAYGHVRYSGANRCQCELANDPGADKAAPLDLQARYDRAADCLLWPRLLNLPNTLPWHQPQSQRACLPLTHLGFGRPN
jgi:hypothetical protein